MQKHTKKSLNYINYSSVQHNLINNRARNSSLDEDYSQRIVCYEPSRPDWSKSFFKQPRKLNERQRKGVFFIQKNIRNVRVLQQSL